MVENYGTPQKSENKPYKIGYALSGGGIKGLCHAGVLKALEEKQHLPRFDFGS